MILNQQNVIKIKLWIGSQEINVQPASKKTKMTPPRPSSRLTSEAATRRAVANGTPTAVSVSSSVSDTILTKPSEVLINRLNEHIAAETTNQATVLMKLSTVEAKTSTDVFPQNSAVIPPALSHSAKV